MEKIFSVVLAAGEGKRMKSSKSKLLHKICGRTIVEWVLDAVAGAGIDESIIVVGHKSEQVKECLGNKQYAIQEKQLGTGHAVMQSEEFLKGKKGIVVVLCGDTPLITSETLKNAIEAHKADNNNVTIITSMVDNPFGYGRVLRNSQGTVEKIVEQADATDKEKSCKEINSGMYCFNLEDLFRALNSINNNNKQGEYYLTDTIEVLINEGKRVGAFKMSDSTEILGINDRIQLAQATEVIRNRIIKEHMLNGVSFIMPNTNCLDYNVRIGKDTVVYSGTIIEGETSIGENCIIGPNTRVVSSIVDDDVEINNSVVLKSSISSGTKVGPFAYLRPNSKIGKKVKVGDFVEVKNSSIGDNTKISHLTYVGDAEVGKNVNLGCGVVTVNYDGKNKSKTIIGDNAFIGCNVNLIAPVEVKNNAYVAAGSTITDQVPEDGLAIARSRQLIKENWVKKRVFDKE